LFLFIQKFKLMIADPKSQKSEIVLLILNDLEWNLFFIFSILEFCYYYYYYYFKIALIGWGLVVTLQKLQIRICNFLADTYEEQKRAKIIKKKKLLNIICCWIQLWLFCGFIYTLESHSSFSTSFICNSTEKLQNINKKGND